MRSNPVAVITLVLVLASTAPPVIAACPSVDVTDIELIPPEDSADTAVGTVRASGVNASDTDWGTVKVSFDLFEPEGDTGGFAFDVIESVEANDTFPIEADVFNLKATRAGLDTMICLPVGSSRPDLRRSAARPRSASFVRRGVQVLTLFRTGSSSRIPSSTP